MKTKNLRVPSLIKVSEKPNSLIVSPQANKPSKKHTSHRTILAIAFHNLNDMLRISIKTFAIFEQKLKFEKWIAFALLVWRLSIDYLLLIIFGIATYPNFFKFNCPGY